MTSMIHHYQLNPEFLASKPIKKSRIQVHPQIFNCLETTLVVMKLPPGN